MSLGFLKLIICSAAALLTWAYLPGTFIDHRFFSLTARVIAKPSSFITGEGTHRSPYALHTFKTKSTLPANPLLSVVIGNDPDRVFQTSPPSPVDFAVILKNMRRLGCDSIAIGMPLAWPEPDVISLVALEQQLDAVPTLITAAPLSRGAVATPLPPAFRRASIAILDIQGDIGSLPVVNRVAIPDTILGNRGTLAGFTFLESEADSEFPNLLARWEDRVVLSFSLLAALADRGITTEMIEIRLGKFISLGKEGPFIPIDEFGRLAFSLPFSDQSASSIPAETFIDAPDDYLSKQRSGTILMRNGMSQVDVSSMHFSENLVSTVSVLADPSGISTSESFQRIPWPSELLFIASLIFLLLSFGYFPKIKSLRTLMIFAGFFVVLHFILVLGTGIWPPTLPALAAIITAIPSHIHRLHDSGNIRRTKNTRRRNRWINRIINSW